MPRQKLHGTRMIHVGVSMPPETWEVVQVLGRGRHISASQILREALGEYLTRRGLGHTAGLPEPERTAVAV